METITGEKITVTCGSCLLAVKNDIDPLNIGAERQLFCYAEPPKAVMTQTPQGLQVMPVNPPVSKDRPACGFHTTNKEAFIAAKK